MDQLVNGQEVALAMRLADTIPGPAEAAARIDELAARALAEGVDKLTADELLTIDSLLHGPVPDAYRPAATRVFAGDRRTLSQSLQQLVRIKEGGGSYAPDTHAEVVRTALGGWRNARGNPTLGATTDTARRLAASSSPANADDALLAQHVLELSSFSHDVLARLSAPERIRVATAALGMHGRGAMHSVDPGLQERIARKLLGIVDASAQKLADSTPNLEARRAIEHAQDETAAFAEALRRPVIHWPGTDDAVQTSTRIRAALSNYEAEVGGSAVRAAV